MSFYLIQGLGYGFAAAVQPGPFQAYLISQTLVRGWRRTLPATLAPLVSDGPILLLCLFVLSQVPTWLQRLLSLAGGSFVLYLAWGAFVAWRRYTAQVAVASSGDRQSVLQAAMMNALSPGPYLYWSLVTGPILLRGWRSAPANGVGFLVSFYCALVLSLTTIVLLFGSARRLGTKVNHVFLGISALALAGFGLYQLWIGFSGVW
jgi:threonine/homoserine/homoserine lactone efflux protein